MLRRWCEIPARLVLINDGDTTLGLLLAVGMSLKPESSHCQDGNIDQTMAAGIDYSATVVVFVTKNCARLLVVSQPTFAHPMTRS